MCLVSGCGLSKKSEDPVLARFDGTTIRAAEFKEKVGTLPRDLRSIAAKRKKDFLEDITAEHFLLREARRRHLEDRKDVKNLIEAAKKKIIIAKLIEIEVDRKIKIEPDEALDYYQAHKPEFMTPLLLRASHILVKTADEAGDIKAKLDAGADFEELAKARSVDTTAARGGDLGYFQKGQLVPEFEEAAFRMKKGQTGDAVKTAFGYHVIRLTDRVEPSLRDFKSVRRFVEERILGRKRSQSFKAFVEKLKGGSKIEIDEKALDAVSIDPSEKSE